MGFRLNMGDVDQWIELYRPVTNTVNPEAGWSTDGAAGVMFETYGEDLARVQAMDVHNVWTWVDTDNGSVIIEGYHVVDRLGYFITELPWVDGLDYEVKVGDNVQI